MKPSLGGLMFAYSMATIIWIQTEPPTPIAWMIRRGVAQAMQVFYRRGNR
jgi:hypothetical protein